MKEALDKWRSRLETVMAETLIYHWINQKPRYGKELIKLTKSQISSEIKTPTIYAILNRGKSQGLLDDFEKSNKDKITRGIERKYYRLSDNGKAYYSQLKLYFENATYMHELFQHEAALELSSLVERSTRASFTKIDFVILGYLNLHGKTTYNNICQDLNLNSENVIQSIARLNSSYDIEIEENLVEKELGIIYLENKQTDLFNLVFKKIDKDGYSQIHGLMYDDILNMKLLAGFLLVKQEIRGVKYLIQYFNDNGIPILSKIKYEELLQYIGLLSLNQYLNIQISPEGWIITNKVEKIPFFNENTILPGYDWINYNELIGWLSSNRITSLFGFTNILNSQEILDFKVNEAPLIISLLVADGVLEGILVDDSTLHITKINKQIQNEYLSKNDRILLGFIKSFKQKKLYDFAAILDVELETARQLISQFVGKSNVSIEIARDGTLMVKNLDLIPTQIQPAMLNIQLQEMFGYLKEEQTIEISTMETIWNTSKTKTKSSVLELVGYGLIEISMDKNNFRVINKKSSNTSFLQKISEIQDILIQNVEEWPKENITISEFADDAKLKHNDLIRKFSQLVALGIYPNGYFDGNYFTKNGDAKIMHHTISCENCGSKMESHEEICINCEWKRWFCIVCRGIIKETENINSCPFCNQRGHKSHLTKWLQISEKCPACRSELSINQLEEKT